LASSYYSVEVQRDPFPAPHSIAFVENGSVEILVVDGVLETESCLHHIQVLEAIKHRAQNLLRLAQLLRVAADADVSG